VIVAADVVLAGCSALAGACAALDHVRVRLALSLDALIERDRRDTPQPTRCVLVLDDEEGGRDSMRLLLAPLSAEVLTASTPAEARALISARRPAAIVADYYLRGETSAALLRGRPAYARAVLVTGAVDLAALAGIARGCGADLRERPITLEAQDALCALVASYLPPEST
jgi:DNA-binding NtrC family response regulator